MKDQNNAKITAYDVLDTAVKQLNTFETEVKTLVKTLDTKQMNWQPGPGKWSVLQVIEHITINTGLYIKPISVAIAKGMPNQAKNYGFYKPGILGGLLYSFVDPEKRNKNRSRSPKIFRPSEKTPPNAADVLPLFYETQHKLQDLMEKAKAVNTQALRISSPALSFIKFHLADAFRILGAHQARHLLQIKEILSNPGFPKKH